MTFQLEIKLALNEALSIVENIKYKLNTGFTLQNFFFKLEEVNF